jgi:hypothetical protein
MRPLGGARVRIDSSALVSLADSSGRFHIEGIPPGQHYVRVEHPVIDTMGIVLRSETESFASGETKAMSISTPSPETLVSLVCSPAWRARGPALLMGRVWEADTDKPAVGAKVSLVWYELDVSSGVRRAPRVREMTVGADGTYRICGLPAQLDGRLQVIRGGLTSGDIPISFGQDVLAMRSMSIAAPSTVVATPGYSTKPDTVRKRAAPSGTARLTGRVVNKLGQPLVGARVQLEGTTRAASTRVNGEFVLDSLPSGTQNVSVRLLGYAPVEKPVDLSSRLAQNVIISMDAFVPVLEAVRVTAQRERALDDVGFSRRKRMGMGWYMESDEIKRRNALNFSDLLRTAPGLRVSQTMNRQVIENSRDPVNGCVNVYIDGSQWQQMEPGDVDDFVKPYEIASIEVYSATMTPAEYSVAGRGSCSTILAWTYRRLDRKR